MDYIDIGRHRYKLWQVIEICDFNSIKPISDGNKKYKLNINVSDVDLFKKKYEEVIKNFDNINIVNDPTKMDIYTKYLCYLSKFYNAEYYSSIRWMKIDGEKIIISVKDNKINIVDPVGVKTPIELKYNFDPDVIICNDEKDEPRKFLFLSDFLHLKYEFFKDKNFYSSYTKNIDGKMQYVFSVEDVELFKRTYDVDDSILITSTGVRKIIVHKA